MDTVAVYFLIVNFVVLVFGWDVVWRIRLELEATG
jgi:hypothetical protein